ncbi:uncharacterized protein HD556DRAFT_1241373 [Suillus plorans]|uniref:Uncharacterized protein n=1 Tax=Suillus plorans TaxID=116603 RepID=A0A9P7AJQ0_9AGAM|nr:uncharacterized protein HD556DRAFT_1241373 [Suillus plorans]KAG1790870.1 hypothetical protein HD556DRAFT_1241373 [Suillus plorans]
MPRIRNDPNLNICLDYASVPFAAARNQIINENVSEVQAVQILQNIWEVANDVEKVLWREQLEVDREQLQQQRLLQEEQEDRLEQEKLEEEETARKEERKKHKHKYMPIQATGIPDEPSITPSAYTTRKLDKGKYVELWYFTNDGLDEALTKKAIVDNDAMVLSTLADGSTAWITAASVRNASSVINDEDLTFEDFCQACPRFITAIE